MVSFLSNTQIANMALSHIAARSNIESLDENSQEALAARLWYQASRTSILEKYDWTFARKRRELALTGEGTDEWQYRYVYPSDCIRARKIVPKGVVRRNVFNRFYGDTTLSVMAHPFQIELDETSSFKTILTGVPEAVLQYTTDVTNTSLFSRAFALALSYELAGNMAMKLTGKAALKQAMQQAAYQYIAMAAVNDANEGIAEEAPDTDWIRGRQ